VSAYAGKGGCGSSGECEAAACRGRSAGGVVGGDRVSWGKRGDARVVVRRTDAGTVGTMEARETTREQGALVVVVVVVVVVLSLTSSSSRRRRVVVVFVVLVEVEPGWASSDGVGWGWLASVGVSLASAGWLTG